MTQNWNRPDESGQPGQPPQDHFPRDYPPHVQQHVPPQWQQRQPQYHGQPYYPPPGWQQPQFAPPPRRGWVRRHPVLTGILSAVLLFFGIGVGASLGSKPQDGTGASSFGSSQPAAPATSAVAKTSGKQTVTFAVTGTPGADVTYGPAGTSVSGTSPMRVTKPLSNPVYYSLQAQLQGGGQVTCKILVDGKVISEAVASGGYNIADCEISKDMFSGEWSDTNAA